MILESRFDDADTYISRVFAGHPEDGPLLIDWVVRAELLDGKYDQAYKDSVAWVSEPGVEGEQDLYLSLASAARGQVYPGQAEYCERCISDHLRSHGLTALEGELAETHDSHGVMVLSAIALGTMGMPEFLELALRLDPVNEFAADQAIRHYGFKGRYSEIRRIASGLASRLPEGKSRDYYLHVASSVANLKDKPLPPAVGP